jgi:hypothetical protein
VFLFPLVCGAGILDRRQTDVKARGLSGQLPFPTRRAGRGAGWTAVPLLRCAPAACVAPLMFGSQLLVAHGDHVDTIVLWQT